MARSIGKKFRKIMIMLFAAVIACTQFFAVFSAPDVEAQAASRVAWSTVKTTIVEIAGKRIYDEAYKVLSYVNKERVKQGLNKLTIDSDLTEYAMVRAAEMAFNNEVGHKRPNGVTSGAENATKNSSGTAKSAYTGWYNSSGHYNNMMNSEYTNVGIGCFYYAGTYWWIMSFGCDAVNEYIKGDYSWTGNGKYSTTNKTVSQPIEVLSDSSVKYYLDGTCSHCWKFTKATTKATTDEKGKVKYTCTYCGKTKTVTSAKIKSTTLSTTSYTYNGKAKKPTVTVKDSKGYIISPKYYTVTYINRSTGKEVSTMKNVGKYYVKIKFKTKYSGTVKKAVTIKPKGTTVNWDAAVNDVHVVKIKKQTTQTTGYQVQYSTSSEFPSKSTKTITVSNTTTSVKLNFKEKNKKYYVRIRTYKTVKINGKSTKIYSKWGETFQRIDFS